MAVAIETGPRATGGTRTLGGRQTRPSLAGITGRRRFIYLTVLNALALAAALTLAEIAFRWLWNPKYWIHTRSLLVGSGQTEAGKKWWPETTYLVDSSEFRIEFRTNALGYRARTGAAQGAGADRIAFVGDSFTEGLQVPYEATFCARLERLLNERNSSRRVVCENYGVSATDLPDYWHRIVHDVLAGDPPRTLVLCIYPGNDFQCVFPDDAFDRNGLPLRDYYKPPGRIQHLIAWVNLHSKFGCYVQRGLLSAGSRAGIGTGQGPKHWWTDPLLAETAADAPAVRRSRAPFAAIDEECRRRGTKLCVLVVGPVANYKAKNGRSPLAQILASWGLDIPVVDVAITARATPDYQQLIFPLDGHLNQGGHDFLAREAAPALEAVIASTEQASRR